MDRDVKRLVFFSVALWVYGFIAATSTLMAIVFDMPVFWFPAIGAVVMTYSAGVGIRQVYDDK